MIVNGIIQLAISKIKSKSITLNISAVGFKKNLLDFLDEIKNNNSVNHSDKFIISTFSPIQNTPYYQLVIEIEKKLSDNLKNYSAKIGDYNINGVISYSPIIENIYGRIPNRINLYTLRNILYFVNNYDIENALEQGLLGSDDMYIVSTDEYSAEYSNEIDNVEIKTFLEGSVYIRSGCKTIYTETITEKKVVKNYNVITTDRECTVENITVETEILGIRSYIKLTISAFCTVFSIDELQFESSSEYYTPTYLYS